MIKLRGTFTALVTPFKQAVSGAENSMPVDYHALKTLVRFQLESGVTGLVPLGTTGETPTLYEDEEDKIIIAVREETAVFEKKTGRKIPLILGAGSNSTADAVKYTRRAKDAGADYALVVTPYYNKPSDEGIFRHFEAVSKVGIPVIVYNIAGRTGKNIVTPLLSRIADLPNIAGVKEASGDINQMMDVIRLIAARKSGFSVLSGDDSLTLPLAALGGDGIISVVSNVAPAEVSSMTTKALAGDFEGARRDHYTLLPIFKAAFVETNPCPIKFAMKSRGLIPDYGLRLPLVPILKDSEQVVLAALKESGLM